jgi:hypothetical protein
LFPQLYIFPEFPLYYLNHDNRNLPSLICTAFISKNSKEHWCHSTHVQRLSYIAICFTRKLAVDSICTTLGIVCKCSSQFINYFWGSTEVWVKGKMESITIYDEINIIAKVDAHIETCVHVVLDSVFLFIPLLCSNMHILMTYHCCVQTCILQIACQSTEQPIFLCHIFSFLWFYIFLEFTFVLYVPLKSVNWGFMIFQDILISCCFCYLHCFSPLYHR